MEDHVDGGLLVVALERALVALDHVPRLALLGHLARADGLADEAVAEVHGRAARNDVVGPELLELADAQAGDVLRGRRVVEALGVRAVLLLVLDAAVHERAEEPALHARLVDEQRVLLVPAAQRGDAHAHVRARRHGLGLEQLLGLRHDERDLRVHLHVRYGFAAFGPVSRVPAARLLAHGGLVGHAGRLVVVGEGDERGHDAEHERRVELQVRVAGGVGAVEVFRADCDAKGALLLFVDIFDDLRDQQRLEARLVGRCVGDARV